MYWLIDQTGRYVRRDLGDVMDDEIIRAREQITLARDHIAVSEALVAQARQLRHARQAESALPLRTNGIP